MSNQRNTPKQPTREIQPFPPERSRQFLQQLKGALGLVEGRTLGLKDLEQLTGRRAGTIGHWQEGAPMEQVEFIFSLLERLPGWLRHQLVDELCRVQPTLRHPRLSHDPLAVRQLEDLLAQRHGLTVIQGTPDHMRPFLLAALGNTFHQSQSGKWSVCGLDFHAGTWLTAPGLIEVGRKATPQQLQEWWAQVQTAPDHSLVVLGPLWQLMPTLQPQMLQLATRCHVVVTTALPLKMDDLKRRLPGQLHRLTVAAAPEQPAWIKVTVRCD